MAVTKITGAGLGLPNADGNALGGASNEWSDLYLADSSVIYFGNDQDITLTHAADTGLTTNGTFQATTITATTAVVPDASDGAALGTTSLEWSDLYLADGAVVGFGDDQDVTLTHVADTGLLLNSTMAIQFNDASQYINAPSATVLDINATDEIELNATLVDINANVEISGTATTTGVHTFTAVPVFPNNTVETADIQDNAVTLAKMAGGTDGNIISYDASGDPVAIATGNDGQVLTSTGAGSPPAFEDAAGGGAWNLIGTVVASNDATLTVTGLNSTYDTYAIICSDILLADDNDFPRLRVGDSGGIDSSSGDYEYRNISSKTSVTTFQSRQSTSATEIQLSGEDGVGNATGEGFGMILYLFRPGDATAVPSFSGHCSYTDHNPVSDGGFLSGHRVAVITLDRVELSAGGSGNITSGRFSVWGIAHA